MQSFGNIYTSLFDIALPSDKPMVGKMLISEPFLKEPYFRHSVILLVDHEGKKTSMGLVMNHQSDYMLHQLMPSYQLPQNIPVYCGGPMDNEQLFYVHHLGNLIDNSVNVAENIWVGGNFDQVVEYLNSGYPVEGNIRFTLGYSGWDQGQLKEEMQSHVWAVASPDSASVLTGAGDKYWHRYVRSLGKHYRNWLYHPYDASIN